MIAVELGLNDGATPRLRALGAMLGRPEALLLPTARQGATLLRRYYRGLDGAKANRLGGARTHYWQKVASSVNNPVLRDRTGAGIAIGQAGLGLHVSGGTVRPREKQWLAIPIHAESHGVWARDWRARHPDRPLFRIRGKRNLLLAEAVGDGVRPLYVLKKEQQIPPDPEALPAAKNFETPLVRFARKRLDQLLRKSDA